MLSRIRYCYKCNEKFYIIMINRHYSSSKIKNHNPINSPTNSRNETKISQKLTSLLNDSIDSLQDYLLRQTPEYTEFTTGSRSETLLYSQSQERNFQMTSISDLPSSLHNINDKRIEYLDLRNPKDIDLLANIPKDERFSSVPEATQFMERTGKCNVPRILNLYIRGLPEISDNHPKLRESKVKLNDKSLQFIFKVLVNQQWFASASFLLHRMNLTFDDLMNFMNEAIDNEPIFQRSNWMKYIFLINALQIYKDFNPQVLSNIEFLNSEQTRNRFKIMNTLYNSQFNSESQLENELNDIKSVGFGDDVYVKLMYYYKMVDVIKLNSINSKLQNQKLTSLILKVGRIVPKTETFYAMFIPHICGLNNHEIKYIIDENISEDNVHTFVSERKSHVLNFLILNQRIQLKGFDMLSILLCKPSFECCQQLWSYHLNRVNQSLQGTIFYKFIVNAFIAITIRTPLFDEIVNVEFSNLSMNKKKSVIYDSIHSYLKSTSITTRNRAGNHISKITDYHEHSHIMNAILKLLFWHNDNKKMNNMINLFKFMELISSWSPLVYNKRKLFEKINRIIMENRSPAFQVFPLEERFDRLIQMIDLIKSIDHDSPKYLMALQPSLIVSLNEYIISTNASIDELVQDERVMCLSEQLSQTFEVASSNSDKLLVALNPKSYKSKAYFSQQSLLQIISRTLNSLPFEIYEKIIDYRVSEICNKKEDWISNFNRSIDSFSIFLEIFLRRGLRDDKSDTIGLSSAKFRDFLNKESMKMAHDNRQWSLVQHISGFDWDVDIKETVKVEKSHSLGEGIIYVFNSLKNVKGLDDKDKNFMKGELDLNRLAIKVDKEIDSVTNLLFDSIGDVAKIDTNTEINFAHDEGDQKGLLEQDFLEYNELYQNLKRYQDYVAHKSGFEREVASSSLKDEKLEFGLANKELNELRKRYTKKEKEKLLRFFGPIRVKCILIESIIEKNPLFIDKLIVKLYEDYDDLIPVSLLHSAMIGIIKSNDPKIDFVEKINIIKVIDHMIAMIYSSGAKRSNSYLFMRHVKFLKFRTELVDLIINESKKSNSGSLKTLNWAMKKIINAPNLKDYKKHINKWTNELNNMKDAKIGFWNPTNIYNIWDRNKD
ncbi:hypothetical protein CANINC_003289 [Pichia inconspicua]|uniref:Uncharacterized protein n=1 Tax=Pichia inconspicua TaxID=52247 RepID=A0A4T0WYZ1_9ASCO|nr:hypothetical protein CANINC_003289 [[Candida] inconspicua]